MRFSTQMMYQQNMRGITNSQAEWILHRFCLRIGDAANG